MLWWFGTCTAIPGLGGATWGRLDMTGTLLVGLMPHDQRTSGPEFGNAVRCSVLLMLGFINVAFRW